MIGDNWYAPRDINFSKHQLISFLLPNLSYIRDGVWPNEPDEYITYIKGIQVKMKRSSYEKSRGKSINRIAPFIIVGEIAAEIDARMALIGKLSEILELIYTLNEEPLEVARSFRLTEEDLSWNCRKMLTFISGWRRRRIDYRHWLLLGAMHKLGKKLAPDLLEEAKKAISEIGHGGYVRMEKEA